MSVEKGWWRRDPAVRVSLFLGIIFLGTGAGMPFVPRWLETERGLTGLEIGLVVSSAALARVVVGPLIAAWADGFKDRRTPLQILPIAAALAYAAFWQSHGLVALIITGFVAATLAAAVTPLTEGAILRATVHSRVPYGVARAFGSATFIIGAVVGGIMVSRFGAEAAVIWVLASLATTALVGLVGLKPDPAPVNAHAMGYRERLAMTKSLLANPRFAATILGCGLIQAGHAFYYNFSTLVWEKQAIDPAIAGVLWAVGVIVEVAFLASLPLIERRFGPEALILVGGGAAVVRWSAMALAPPLAVLWPLQALHALTFAATHVGALRIIQRETPESVAGLGQTLYAAVASGTLMGLAAIGSGVLYDHFGAGGYWAMAAMALAGAMLIARMIHAATKSN